MYSKVWPRNKSSRVGGVYPVTISLLVLCEKFSFKASMLPFGWHVLWNVTDKRVWVMYKCCMMT
jgi:hypothetical protein